MELPNEMICKILSRMIFTLEDLNKYLRIPGLSELLPICVRHLEITKNIEASKLLPLRGLRRVTGPSYLIVDDASLLHRLDDYSTVFPDRETIITFLQTVNQRHFYRGRKQLHFPISTAEGHFPSDVEYPLVLAIDNGRLIRGARSWSLDWMDFDNLLFSILIERKMFTDLILYPAAVLGFRGLLESITTLDELELIIYDDRFTYPGEWFKRFSSLHNLWKIPTSLKLNFNELVEAYPDPLSRAWKIWKIRSDTKTFLDHLPVLTNIRSFIAPMNMENIELAIQKFPNLQEIGIYIHYFETVLLLIDALNNTLMRFDRFVLYHSLTAKDVPQLLALFPESIRRKVTMEYISIPSLTYK